MFTTLLAPRILAPLLAVLVLSTGAPPARTTPPQNRRAVELTFLKSTPGQREPLKQFIVRNWFAMDRIAVQQGLMRSFTVMDTGTDDGPRDRRFNRGALSIVQSPASPAPVRG